MLFSTFLLTTSLYLLCAALSPSYDVSSIVEFTEDKGENMAMPFKDAYFVKLYRKGRLERVSIKCLSSCSWIKQPFQGENNQSLLSPNGSTLKSSSLSWPVTQSLEKPFSNLPDHRSCFQRAIQGYFKQNRAQW